MEHRRRPTLRNQRRRKSRGRFGFLYKLLSTILIGAALVAGCTLFFKTAEIEVEGAQRYTAQEITAVSGVKSGSNLILLNKYAVANRIFAALPYVDTVVIRRELPGTLLIYITESTAAASVQSGADYYLIDQNGKLLERCEADAAAQYPQILGVELDHPSVGANMDFGTEKEQQKQHLLRLLAVLEEKEMRINTRSIDLSEETVVSLAYLDRFTVRVPAESDYAYKLKYLEYIVDVLASNEKGKIDLTREAAHFIPAQNET